MEVEKILKKIKKQFDENINSHVFLVDTNDTTLALESIKTLLAEILSKGDPITRNQILNENYLELIIIRSDGKMIKRDSINELQERLKTKPTLSSFIAYIIVPAEDLNEVASNKLLKTIEEPNPNIVGFLISKNTDLLLPTIKSRCEKMTLNYENLNAGEEIPENVHDIVKKLINALELKDHPQYYKIKIDKNVKENGQLIENLIKDYYNMACNLKSNQCLDSELVEFIRNNNSFKNLVKKTKYIDQTMNKLTKNLNIDIFLEKIFFDMKEVVQNDNSRS